jgi:peptidyl-prolyl cis-trans isomerase SurA
MNKSIFFLIGFFSIVNIFSQKKDPVLLTIDKKPVYTSEFIDVYNKNKDIIIDNEQKTVDDYLNLFINYKLKLLYAYEQKLDTTDRFKNELNKYREQLTTPYLKNQEEMLKLTKEAYQRTQNEVNVSHILIMVTPNAAPADTLAAYKKIQTVYTKAVSGIPFSKVAQEYSEDNSVKFNKGDLGFFSAFQMTYNFENYAYNTPVGTLSKPFRTEFGYHIIKVKDKRVSPGKVEVGLIFIKDKPGDSVYAKSLINDIYSKLQQKEDFKYLAQKYSDDKSSAAKGGVLPKFGTGKLIQPLDSMAFSLQKEGEYTKPFQSDYGWHILTLIKKYPVQSYEELKNELEYKVRNSNRSVIIKRSLAENLSKELNVIENKPVIEMIYRNNYSNTSEDTSILSIENKNYTLKDFNFYKRSLRNKSGREIYMDFKADKIIDYYKIHLEEYSNEFSKTLKEYRDGLLLFDLLQNYIWKRAESDSVGLEKYFNEHIDKYQWQKRAEMTIANCSERSKAERVRQFMTEGKTPEEIKSIVNEGPTIHVIFKETIVEEGSTKLPAGYILKEGISGIFQEDDRHFIIINVHKVFPAGPKQLKETKGQVINDYQNYLEEQWADELRKEHKVIINKRTLKKLKKNLNE